MSNSPYRSHVRSYSSHSLNDSDTFISEQHSSLISPPLPPSYKTIKDATTPRTGPPSPAFSYKTDSYLRRPTSYKDYTSEMGESYPLADTPPLTPLQVAERDLQIRAKSDDKLKRFVRRFRFAVRTFDLGCRYNTPSSNRLI